MYYSIKQYEAQNTSVYLLKHKDKHENYASELLAEVLGNAVWYRIPSITCSFGVEVDTGM